MWGRFVVVFWLSLGLLVVPAWSAARQPMLPMVDDGQTPVAGWWMSEKLDGVRGYWDGHHLWSKHGKQLFPPKEFTAGWPPFPLEGELWGGRGRFEQTVAIVARKQPHPAWRKLQFGIFDVPAAPGSFRQRLPRAEQWFAEHPSAYAFVIPQQPVRDREQLQRELRRIEGLGGEGLIVRDPAAAYRAGRSPLELKVKRFRDAEAVVVGHLPGKGRLVGMLGALLVELPDGTRFRIGTGFSDNQRRHPPPLGATITFKFQGYFASGVPRFPSFIRIRSDQDL